MKEITMRLTGETKAAADALDALSGVVAVDMAGAGCVHIFAGDQLDHAVLVQTVASAGCSAIVEKVVYQ